MQQYKHTPPRNTHTHTCYSTYGHAPPRPFHLLMTCVPINDLPWLSWLEHTKDRSAELSGGRSEAPSYRIMGNCVPSRENAKPPRRSFEAMSPKEREGVDLEDLRWVTWVP